MSRHDVLILGSGAGGGPLALTLARAGLDVLVVEKGKRHARQDYSHDEVEVLRRSFFTPKLAEEPHTVVTRKSTEPQLTNLGWIATCVGGGTVHMGGYLYRFHPDDFRMRSRFGDFEDLADWPYEYDELEPYYCRAEHEVGVAGVGGATPFEGPRSRPYPLPPLDAHPVAESLEAVCRAKGLSPFPTPRSINSRPYQGRPVCEYCDRCASFGCPVGAKGSSQEALIDRAEATGNCTILPEAMVREVTVGVDGRATGCVYLDTEGAEHRVEAKIVCVCCSAIESARLLLLSKSSRFPAGLANGNGRVGRHLQFHSVSLGVGRFHRDRHPDKALDDPHPFLGRSVMDHYFLPEGISPLAKGGVLRFSMGGSYPIDDAQFAASRGSEILWGMALKERIRQIKDYRTIHFEVFHDYIPNRHTLVELDDTVKDKWGLPVARIHLDPHEHHKVAGHWLTQRAFEILRDLGADELAASQVGGTSAYLVHGTCRAGVDPATSVLDPYCQTHEVPNLFVVDGSFMPTSGGASPTLTILANSFRTADHILARHRAGEFG